MANCPSARGCLYRVISSSASTTRCENPRNSKPSRADRKQEREYKTASESLTDTQSPKYAFYCLPLCRSVRGGSYQNFRKVDMRIRFILLQRVWLLYTPTLSVSLTVTQQKALLLPPFIPQDREANGDLARSKQQQQQPKTK